VSFTTLLFLLLGLGAVAWASGRARARAFAPNGRRAQLHSLPNYHGWYAALWAVLPALLFLVLWFSVLPALAVDNALGEFGGSLPAQGAARDALVAEAHALASGQITDVFDPRARTLAPLLSNAEAHLRTVGTLLAALLAFAGGAYGLTRLSPDFRARTRVERVTMGLLLVASLIAILTTLGIVLSLLFESLRFFSLVSPFEFLFGTRWSPQTAIRADQAGSSGAFGAIPLFWGTVFIGAIIAMLVAIPLGLMSAVYLTQYAGRSARKWLKPTLEILAGVPTVVYGYFAALTVAPAVRALGASLGIESASSESALAAGLVMGVMIIPFVSSMADDSLAAVPGAMRDGSLAMGATTSETIRRVLLPAALPGVVGGVLLAVSRAIGETMIVVMAAGLAANLTANPFASVTTVTTQIVQLLTGDQEFDSAKTLAAFALGLVLFLVTLFLNIVALRVVKRYREAYE